MIDVYQDLVDIVGESNVSSRAEELFYYSRDPGLMPPKKPDYVVLPESADEVQDVVKLANENKIPIVPMGSGKSLTGLTIPLEGGIVMDMKRMKGVIEVNEKSRNVILKAGTSQGELKAYLEDNYPELRHSMPDAPPTATIAGNVAIHGQGRLSQQYGYNSDMVSGLEVVLPTGEICRVGSCALSEDWFSRGPTLPDLSGLFLGWLGSTGVITKLGLKLYPKKKMRDAEMFVTDKEELVPEILYKITHTEMVEDLNVFFQPKPVIFKDNYHITIIFTGDKKKELEFKREMIWDSVKEFRKNKDGGFMWVMPDMKPELLEMPQESITRFADVAEGGGFTYSGPIISPEKYPLFARKLKELGDKHDIPYAGTARVIGRNHALMFAFGFPFDRSDPDMMERVKKAEREASSFARDNGAIPWKPNIEEQEMAMEDMDSKTLDLMKMIKENLDPDNIMNPGNWEMD